MKVFQTFSMSLVLFNQIIKLYSSSNVLPLEGRMTQLWMSLNVDGSSRQAAALKWPSNDPTTQRIFTKAESRIGKRVLEDNNRKKQKVSDSIKPSGFGQSEQILHVRVCDLVETPRRLTCFPSTICTFCSRLESLFLDSRTFISSIFIMIICSLYCLINGLAMGQ